MDSEVSVLGDMAVLLLVEQHGWSVWQRKTTHLVLAWKLREKESVSHSNLRGHARCLSSPARPYLPIVPFTEIRDTKLWVLGDTTWDQRTKSTPVLVHHMWIWVSPRIHPVYPFQVIPRAGMSHMGVSKPYLLHTCLWCVYFTSIWTPEHGNLVLGNSVLLWLYRDHGSLTLPHKIKWINLIKCFYEENSSTLSTGNFPLPKIKCDFSSKQLNDSSYHRRTDHNWYCIPAT